MLIAKVFSKLCLLKMNSLQRQHTRDDADVISDRWQKEQKYSSAAAHPTGLKLRKISAVL